MGDKKEHLTSRAPVRRWREQDGIIYFSVTSDGTTGEDWIKRLERKSSQISHYAQQVLRSPDFQPTNGVTTEIAVLNGLLFNDNDRITKKIRAEANRRQLIKPNAEVACLIREMFTDKKIEAMGLWAIVVMHEPSKDYFGVPHLLHADRFEYGRWLFVCRGEPGCGWDHGCGFAFAVSPQAPERSSVRGKQKGAEAIDQKD